MSKKLLALFILLTLLFSFSACGEQAEPNSAALKERYQDLLKDLELNYEGDPVAIIETSKGTFVFELFQNQVPQTVENFIKLADSGFYDGLKWHLVVPGVKIQTGDPSGIGTGSSNTAPIPLETHPDLKHDKVGMVGMARYENDLNSATSQFYITLDAEAEWDRKYAVFGQVLKGIETLGAIERGDLISSIAVIRS